ncbi:patatin-like phospholipase family protein [Thermoleophilia bacterium SCSIO 60948]|nr:patatin-like phospholipase family protein [Thermoleophilia bacterium SCSIO 60948]
MGEIVDLDAGGPGSKRRGRRRRRPSKTALVLGGGGLTGGVYEIGALKALDLLSSNSSVNDFDIYVGTSAGAFVSSLVANGVTPEEMMRVLNKDLPSPLRDIDLGTLLRPNYRGFAESIIKGPFRLAAIAREFAGNFRDLSAIDVAGSFGTLFPNGLYSGAGIERYVREALSDPDRTDDFRELGPELFLTATDLDTTERVVLGEGEWARTPISKAVAASGALPVVYAPVTIDDHDFIDGGIRSTTNIDVAVDRGAKFIVVINPLVPFVNDFDTEIPTWTGEKARSLSTMGASAIANQSFRMLSHDRLHRAVEEWERNYPGVDIILIEPELDDELMFGTSILDYRSRLEIAKHGFESVTLKLRENFAHYESICARHGLEISVDRIDQALDGAEEETADLSTWRRVLEQTTATLLRQSSSG